MQECKNCGASWEFQKCLDICPFCGASLLEKIKIETIEEALKYIVNKHGDNLLKEGRLLLGLLADYAPSLTTERQLIKIAVDANAYTRLYDAKELGDCERKKVIEQCVLFLKDRYFLDETWARQVMSWEETALEVELKKEVVQSKIAEILNPMDAQISDIANPTLANKLSLLPSGNLLLKEKEWELWSDGTFVVHSTDLSDPFSANKLESNTHIKKIIFDNGIVETKLSAYENLKYLKEIHFPATLQRIGFSSFANCSALQNIDIPTGVRTISGKAFKGCSCLQNINAPLTVKYIGEDAFSGCSSLLAFNVARDCVVCPGNFQAKLIKD